MTNLVTIKFIYLLFMSIFVNFPKDKVLWKWIDKWNSRLILCKGFFPRGNLSGIIHGQYIKSFYLVKETVYDLCRLQVQRLSQILWIPQNRLFLRRRSFQKVCSKFQTLFHIFGHKSQNFDWKTWLILQRLDQVEKLRPF